MPDGATCLAWSYSGSLLAVGSAGASISMHDSSGARLAQAPCRSAVTAMAWSPLRCRAFSSIGFQSYVSLYGVTPWSSALLPDRRDIYSEKLQSMREVQQEM